MAMEKIVLKPSIDLIPDEYEHFRDGLKIQVNIFYNSNTETEKKLINFREVFVEPIFDLKEYSLEKDNCKEVLNEIGNECTSAGGIIMIFCGNVDEEGELYMFDGNKMNYLRLHYIWNEFYSQNCPALKNKPKIFIFELADMEITTSDGLEHKRPYELTYETPNEADILILYHKKTDVEEDDFIENFCENIKTYGKSEDITSLATCVSRPLYCPMIISTLTRKFYFTASDHRGHRHNIIEKQETLSNEVKAIKNSIPNRKKPERKQTMSFLKKMNSKFRNGGSASGSSKEKQDTDSRSNLKKPNVTVRKTQDAEKQVSVRKKSASSETGSKASDLRGPRHSIIQKEEKLSNEVKESKNSTPDRKRSGIESLYKKIASKVKNGGNGIENQTEKQTDSKSNFKNTSTTVNKSQDAEKRVSVRKTSTTSERDSKGTKSGNVNRPQSNETKKPPVKNPTWKN